MNLLKIVPPPIDVIDNSDLFSLIAKGILEKGYSIHPCALPIALSLSLHEHLLSMPSTKFNEAGIGRAKHHMQNEFVRRDEICWINGDSDAGKDWLSFTQQLQTYLNRRLFMGLFSFESHFAQYASGAFYKKHVDAFKGQANRILSIVVYLNHDWQIDDGGELVLYTHDNDLEGLKVVPSMGTIAIFLSEDFPHEVLPAKRDRYSIAGWFRLNSTSATKVDPPR